MRPDSEAIAAPAGERQVTPIMIGLAALLSSAAIAMAILWIGRSNDDLENYLLPWYQKIVLEGRLTALHAGFADYTPPYIYLLSLCSLTDGFISRIVAIKLCSMLFGLFGAVQIFGICRAVSHSVQFSIVSSLLFFVLPENGLNYIVWGQSDIIYTSFLLAFVRYILIGRRMQAMVMFGIALSFKPQALFIAPFVGSLFLQDLLQADRRLRAVLDMLAAALAFCVMMLPALLAGRSWHFMFTFYAEQFSEQPVATINAPNLYHVIQVLLPKLNTVTYGLVFVLAGCVALMVEFSRQAECVLPAGSGLQNRRVRSGRLLCMVALAAVLVPFITPKMHERYFFAATAMTYALALVRPRYWPVALFMQIAAVLSYMNFLFGVSGVSIFGVVFVAASLAILTAGYLCDRQAATKRKGLGALPRNAGETRSGYV